MTRHGAEPLPPDDDRCCVLIEVTEEEVENSVKHVPSLATVVSLNRKLSLREQEVSAPVAFVTFGTCPDFAQILVRTMLRKRSFGNPFDLARREERGTASAPGQPGL